MSPLQDESSSGNWFSMSVSFSLLNNTLKKCWKCKFYDIHIVLQLTVRILKQESENTTHRMEESANISNKELASKVSKDFL